MAYQPPTYQISLKDVQSNICPHLGLLEDPDSCFDHPIEGNYCHQPDRPFPIKPAHQRDFCLSRNYRTCGIFTGAVSGKIPEDISDRDVLAGDRSPNLLLLSLTLGFIGIFIIAIYLIFFRVGQRFNFGFLPGNTAETAMASDTLSETEGPLPPRPTSTTLPLLAISSPTPAISTQDLNKETLTQTEGSSPFASQMPTQSEPTPGPGLGTPFGPDEIFVLYQVLEGDSITALAAKYQTTVEVIRAANDMIEGQSAWPGSVLVILPGMKDDNAVPVYSIILIDAPTSVTALSVQYGIQVEEIQRINLLGEGDTLPVGRYIILPILSG